MAEVGLLSARVDLQVLSLALGEWCKGGGPGLRRAAACSALADDGRAFSALAALYASRTPCRAAARVQSPPAHPLAPDAHPTPGATRAARDISRGDLTLIVPHLRLPWASDLAAALWRTLGVRLDKRDLNRPPMDFAVIVKTLKDVAEAEASPDCAVDAVADRFYPALPPDDQQYNGVVSQHLHMVHGPGVVEKIANLARLSYVNSLLADVRRQIVQANEEREDLIKTLRANTAKYVASCREGTAAGTGTPHVVRKRSSSSLLSSPKHAQNISAIERCPSGARSQLPNSPRSQIPVRTLAPTFNVGVPQSSSSFSNPSLSSALSTSLPCSPRVNCPRSWHQIHALPVAEHPSAPLVSKFIINGVVVPGKLLQNVRRVLARDFRLDLVIGGSSPPCECPPRGDIDTLSIPMLNLTSVDTLSAAHERVAACPRTRSPRRHSPSALSRCPTHTLEAYLSDCFDMTWPAVCAHAVRVGEVDMCTARMRELDALLAAAGLAEDAAQQVRQELVSTAVAHEVVNAPLSRMCALNLAQRLSGPEINALYYSLPREVWRLVASARERLEELENAESASVVALSHCGLEG
jgi:hypothetical protein